jgi:predicted DNA-binding WGR domain protein
MSLTRENLHRFYQLHVTPGIFGDWALARKWGQVGSPSTVRKDWFAREDEAIAAGEALRVNKEKNGYRTV